MHGVGIGIVDPHRLEGAGADMERDARRTDAGLCQRCQQWRREMQAGGGGGDGAVVAGEERLVIGTILCVGRAAANVGGQGYRAGLFQGCEKFVTAPVERQHDGSVLVLGVDPGRKTVGEGDRIARTQPLGRTCEGKPTTGADVADQQSFERDVLSAAAAGANALKPRRNDLGVVEDQQVPAA